MQSSGSVGVSNANPDYSPPDNPNPGGGIVVGMPNCPPGQQAVLRYITDSGGVARQRWVCEAAQGQQGQTGGWDRVAQYAEDDAACKADDPGSEAVPRESPDAPRRCRKIGGGGGAPQPSSGGGGGGAGGGDSNFSSQSSYQPQTFSDPLQDELDAILMRIFAGDERAFPEKVTADALSRFKSIQEGQNAAGTQAINEDLAARGILRSGVGAELAQGLRSQTAQGFTESATDFFISQANAEFEQKQMAFQVANQELDSRRRLLLGQESNAIDRELGLKQIQLAKLRLDQEWRQALLERDTAIDLAELGIYRDQIQPR
jgi:hypothetical protein